MSRAARQTTAAWSTVSAALEAAVHRSVDQEFVQLTLDAWSNGTGGPRITVTVELSPMKPTHPLP